MSDGPHRSLPMRPGWRKLARRAANCAFEAAEVSAAFIPALESQFHAEVSPSLLKDLAGLAAEPTLFSPLETPQVEVLRSRARYGMETLIFENLAVLSSDDLARIDRLKIATANALLAKATQFVGQIEEHYVREQSLGEGKQVRRRLDEALAAADIGGLVQRLLQPSGPPGVTRVVKKSGLDDGVRLR